MSSNLLPPETIWSRSARARSAASSRVVAEMATPSGSLHEALRREPSCLIRMWEARTFSSPDDDDDGRRPWWWCWWRSREPEDDGGSGRRRLSAGAGAGPSPPLGRFRAASPTPPSSAAGVSDPILASWLGVVRDAHALEAEKLRLGLGFGLQLGLSDFGMDGR